MLLNYFLYVGLDFYTALQFLWYTSRVNVKWL